MSNSNLKDFQAQLAQMLQPQVGPLQEMGPQANTPQASKTPAQLDVESAFRQAQANNNAQMQQADKAAMQAKLAALRAERNANNGGQDTRMNQYGDPAGTVYMGGTPNFYGDYTGADGTFTGKSKFAFDGSSKPAKEKPKAGRQASKTSKQAAKAETKKTTTKPKAKSSSTKEVSSAKKKVTTARNKVATAKTKVESAKNKVAAAKTPAKRKEAVAKRKMLWLIVKKQWLIVKLQ